ncbi:ScbR family autoregulator-binding transcription factor [Streptomyces niger]|uniref:ScbR family autoregulator-binding transcription factor n=1 Tax=Streptomyces niger TaxID=66373 RepID=UPI0006998004|nr:ScbR family autoregulator-binding transcription factor [Streptomyces niger]
MADLKQERALRTRRHLMRAAAELFDECGYEGTSVVRIVERAGLTLGAMYFHFPSKQALAREVMNAQPDVIEPLLDSRGVQRLVDITLVWAQRLKVDPLLRAGVRLAVEQGRFGMKDDTSFENWQQIMATHLEEAREQGQLLPGVQPDEVAQFVVGACTGIQFHSQLASERADLMDRTVRMWRYLLPGIALPEVAATIEIDPKRGRPE